VVLAEWRIAVERRAGGRRIEWWGMSVAEVQGGRIRRWREYWNPADVA
jgi:limonene-1,2-epoxide hydrolase